MTGFVLALAARVSGFVAAFGFTGVKIHCSRNISSRSRYLRFLDAAGRAWVMRVSDHPPRGEHGFARPHFDLIARDCETDAASGAAIAWLGDVARGQVAWTDPDHVRQPRRKRR